MEVDILTDLVIKPCEREVDVPWLGGGRDKFELHSDFVVRVHYEGRTELVVAPKGYVTDLSSIPWFLWWLFPPSSTGARMASVAHDVIYSHYYNHFSKDFADRLFLAIMNKRGATGFMKRNFYRAVKVGGVGGWTISKMENQHQHWYQEHKLPQHTSPKRYAKYLI